MRSLWRAAERSRAANLSGRPHGVARSALREGVAGAGSRNLIMANPFEFIQQVRAEAAKVVWPSRRETLITTGLVLLMAVLASFFFLAIDEILHFAVGYALGIGRHG
jgi:preprotein translocase subunit SecE